MGSQLTTLRTLLENQLNTGITSNSTDPTSTLLNSYINKAIRKIARLDSPRELLNASPAEVDITQNTNTVTMPTTLIVSNAVYYQNSSGSVSRLLAKNIKELIDIQSPSTYFDTTNTGDPSYYTARGTSLVFNKYFDRNATGAIKVFGTSVPSTLTSDSDESDLSVDYDLLTIYEAAVYFYQRDDDQQNQFKFQSLASTERNELRVVLDTNDEDTIRLDPNTFTNRINFNNPSVFFT